MHEVFILSFVTFFTIFTVRLCLIDRVITAFLYHLCIFFILFLPALAGGSVINDTYERLQQFRMLENNNQLEEAKKNPEDYDSMFQIDLRQFKDSNEFEDYIKDIYENDTDLAEAKSMGWFLSALAECSILFLKLFNVVCKFLRKILIIGLE